MALQVSLSSSSMLSTPSSGGSSRSVSQSVVVADHLKFSTGGQRISKVFKSVSLRNSENRRGARVFTVQSSLDIASPVVGQVTEVDKDTFWPLVKGATAEDKIVVLDMYTQWCGPCKVMAPKFAKLAEKYLEVVFMKLDCNNENRPLAKELGIKVVPTFKIFKNNEVVKEVTGAKFDDLVKYIEDFK
ncbi:hypothetical protein C5167_030666 [Papaver somniferum]|uniref:thioredoxin F1, chloroplastic-like n=1 Tax=Papaver somniferum TaxID=3469 RepID=UPI000E705AD5|nr:thioredoxin F1, chloroplastic-like [Papaver somniferum]RZC88972.1 hypothetical protein C5167_030666 [Papaver somniferum]